MSVEIVVRQPGVRRRRAAGFGEVAAEPVIEAVVEPATAPAAPPEPQGNLIDSAGKLLYSAIGTVVAGACAYHGYKRNNESVGWAIGWFFFGGALPVLAFPIALGQGFAKPER